MFEILRYHDAKSFNILDSHGRIPTPPTQVPTTTHPDLGESERSYFVFWEWFMGTCDNN